MKLVGYGPASLVLGFLGFLSLGITARTLPGISLLAFGFLEGAAIICGIVAGIRGSRWWFASVAFWTALIAFFALGVFIE